MIDPGALLKTIIYLISSSLLYPVLLLLVLLALFIVVYAGSFFAEWLGRIRLSPCDPTKLPAILKKGQPAPVVSHRVNGYVQDLHKMRGANQTDEVIVENLLQERSLSLWKSMDRLRILVRVAPALGLIGTLIPMGTGLAALGQGDMTRLTTDLVIAFTTTVVGLAIGTLAFFFYTIRRRWIEQDVKNMELATEVFMDDNERSVYEIRNAASNA